MDTISSRDEGAVRVVTMHRPEARNAMDTSLLGALLDAVGEAAADDGVAAIVITGGRDAFSAGADVKEQLDHAGQVRRMELFADVYEAVATCPTPTVAAVSGPCVGGGVEVAAACDVRVADASARFRFPGAALGFPVGAAKLVGLVGLGAAKELVLTSRTFDLDEAMRIGFVQRRADNALEHALALAGEIARQDRDTITYLKRQFLAFSGLRDRVAAENDALVALAEAGGDYTALTMPDPKRGVGGWSGGGWKA